MNFLKPALIIAALAIFIFACTNAPNSSVANSGNSNTNRANTNQGASPTANPPVDEIAASEELYKKNCMICHKDTGKGGKVTVDGKELEPEDLTSEKFKKRSDEKLQRNISDGAPDDGMPAFKKKLSDDDIKSLVKYVRVLQTK